MNHDDITALLLYYAVDYFSACQLLPLKLHTKLRCAGLVCPPPCLTDFMLSELQAKK